ncbi:hypothetical protein AMS68_007201 [Peltaster fructicola]|uniref:Uncharacterized protein n=1 Tax=Peltaster fructicola TaxID=286661 RepID=A0A6H0Y3U8_9PEZI|nr:hypothetical protein AMS68_007201 [Peltaster fructicola]
MPLRFIYTWLMQSLAPIAFEVQSTLSTALVYRLPTFILDIRHPWIKENQDYFGRLNYPTDAFCSLDGMHKHGLPPDLFRYLEIDNNRYQVNRPGWKNAELRLREMLACPAALHDVEHFRLSCYVSDGSYGIGWPEPSKPPGIVLDLFVQALTSMPNLRKLEWDTFEKGHEEFRQAFAKAKLRLPSVTQLRLAPSADFLVDACVNTQDLRSGGSISSSFFRWQPDADPREQLINSTRALHNLTTFRMLGDWELEYVKALSKLTPGLEALLIDGGLAPRPSSLLEYERPQGSLLTEYLDVLSLFINLEHLRLPASSELELGFDGGAWCGNAYFGRSGRQYGRDVAMRAAETTELAGRMGMQNWTYSIWPLKGDEDDEEDDEEADW